jgi:hypothetical protein
MQPIQQPFEGFAKIADQMPPIEDVLGLWCAQRRAASIFCRAVTAQDGDTRMRLEPCRERGGGTVRQ